MTKYDKALDTRTPEYEEAIGEKRSAKKNEQAEKKDEPKPRDEHDHSSDAND